MPKREDQNERLELARRLHDGPAQKLIALGYRLDSLIGESSLNPLHRSELREIRLDLIDVTEDLRDELYLLSARNLTSLRGELPEILPGFTIELDLPTDAAKPEIENSLATLILEIARNAAKHSTGKRFWVYFESSVNSIQLRVGDDGNRAISMKERSLGLKLINAHVQTLGGEIELRSGSFGNEYRIEIPRR
ncbi:MAG: sensor histidine kinase [Actinomycetota bacterium]